MTPESTVAQLVQAFEFELLNEAGEVVGEWIPQTDLDGHTGHRLALRYPVDPPFDPEIAAGLVITHVPGARSLWLLGPRADESGPPPHTGFVRMFASAGDLVGMRASAGNQGTEPGDGIDLGAFEARRSGQPGSYLVQARMAAGGTMIELLESNGVTQSAVLRRGLAAPAEEIATEPFVGWVKLDEQSPVGVKTASFLNIPQEFTHLRLVGRIFHDNASGAAAHRNLWFRFNGDSSLVYDSQFMRFDTGATVNNDNSSVIQLGWFGPQISGFEATILDYASSAFSTVMHGVSHSRTSSTTAGTIGASGNGFYGASTPITRIDVTQPIGGSTDTFASPSKITLYGMR